MKRLTLVLVAMLAVAGVVAPNAYAGPMTLSTPGIVGTVQGFTGNESNGGAGDPAIEAALAQHLLDMAAGTGPVVWTVLSGGDGHTYTTWPKEYSGTLGPYITGAVGAAVPEGYDFVIGKYDGQNAGYVLFYLPDFDSRTLPLVSEDLWLNNGGNGYGLSGWTAFQTGVPDGGSVAMLLGMALIGLGGLRRFMK